MPLDPHRTQFIQAALLLAMTAPAAFSAQAVDAAFEHEDWQLVCDNTRTCRVAGYQRDDADMPVSVLFIRKAGAGAAVEGRVMLGDSWQDSVLGTLPARFRVVLWIDGKAHVERAVANFSNDAELTQT
mgnify:FL=1